MVKVSSGSARHIALHAIHEGFPPPAIASELQELCRSRPVLSNTEEKTKRAIPKNTKRKSLRRRPEVADASHSSNQKPRNRAPLSTWCVRGVLLQYRSQRRSLTGRNGRIAAVFVCVGCGFRGTESATYSSDYFV